MTDYTPVSLYTNDVSLINLFPKDEHYLWEVLASTLSPLKQERWQWEAVNCECFLVNPFNLGHLCDLMTI